jgi:O-acetylhomoserine (thiol)-lyase
MRGFATKAIHGSHIKVDAQGTLRPPIYDNVAFEFADAQAIQFAFEGRSLAHSYSRVSNPTVEEFENRVRLLSDAVGVIAVASGMAAISNVILTLAESGTNIVTTRFLFGNTCSFLEGTLQPWGLEVKYVDMADPTAVAAAIDEHTRAVFLEVITNPQLQLVDLESLAQIAHERGVPMVLDGTATTPYLLKSKDFGVDIEVISSTKYISGGATSVGGLILDNGTFPWRKNPKIAPWAAKFGPNAFLSLLRREVYRNLGACLSPHNAFLQTLGLETLNLRIDKSCANALAVAHWLERQHPRVVRVNYPGLESSPYHCLADRLLPRGAGGILTFDLQSRKQCFAFQDALTLVRRATNINDNKSLILHPASTIYCEYSPPAQREMGVSDSMLRFSVGIEDLDDIIEDLERGLAAL